MSRKGERAHSVGADRGGSLGGHGGARPRDKSVSVEKAWVEIMDEERKM